MSVDFSDTNKLLDVILFLIEQEIKIKERIEKLEKIITLNGDKFKR